MKTPISNDQLGREVNSPNTEGEEASPKSVRGSGFTYDEEEGRTDESLPIDSSTAFNEKIKDVVPLPDLGQPGRP